MVQGNFRSAITNGFLFFAVLLVSLATLPWTASFWLDETVSAWVSSGNLQATLARAWKFQGSSPLYFGCLWLWRQAFGQGEVALRLFSLFPFLLTLYVIWRMALHYRLNPALAGIFAVAHDGILKTGFTARPYAWALCFTILACEALLTKGKTWKAKVLIFTLLGFYFHYFAPLVVVMVAATVRISWRTAAALGITGLVAALPGLYHLMVLQKQLGHIQFAAAPNSTLIIQAIAPPYIMLYVIMAALLACIFRPQELQLRQTAHAERIAEIPWPALFVWAFGLPLLLLLCSFTLGPNLLVDRYYLFAAPGICLLLAALFARCTLNRAGEIALFTIFAFALYRDLGREWQLERWREASQELSILAPQKAFLYSGLSEVDDQKLRGDPDYREYLLAPFRVYPPTSSIHLSAFSPCDLLPLAQTPPPSLVYLQRRNFACGDGRSTSQSLLDPHVIVAKDLGLVRIASIR